ncbi:MAG: Pr6Pr family membrane protein [Oscillospiraceae bacterium]|jgi:hypothetical protein|nr:Pr6Pr family membrane protein [Oscillospiraceae bacterium]
MIQDRRFALAFRSGSFLFAVAGILKQIGVFSGSVSFGAFMYYTILSNLLAAALFAVLTARTARGLREGTRGGAGWYPRLGMICAVDLLVTLIVFWVLLAPQQDVSAGYLWTFENIAVHTVTPLLCLLDYIFFAEARTLKYRDVYYVCIFPICYVIFTVAAGLAGYVYGYEGILSSAFSSQINLVPVRFPYFFLDFDRLGMMAAVYIGGILIFFLLLGHGIFLIDRKVRKPGL